MDTSQKVHQYMESIKMKLIKPFCCQSDESVSLSLNGKHQLIDMQISAAAMKLSAHDLSQLIIQTHEQALLQISNATRQKYWLWPINSLLKMSEYCSSLNQLIKAWKPYLESVTAARYDMRYTCYLEIAMVERC